MLPNVQGIMHADCSASYGLYKIGENKLYDETRIAVFNWRGY
jgi:hypothetical protein